MAKKHIDNLIERFPELVSCRLMEAAEELVSCYRRKNKLLICGNGGSASDSIHIVGELMKGFHLPRSLSKCKVERIKALYPKNAQYFIKHLQESLTAISLVNEPALLTAYANDEVFDLVFAQQVIGYGDTEDVLLAISTSGKSKNVLYAAQIAKVQNMRVISLTGEKGGELSIISDIAITAPSNETFIVQEYHMSIYHALCAAVESEIMGE